MNTRQFLIRRLIQIVITVFGIMTILFLLLQMSTDPAEVLAGPGADVAMVEATRARLGLDQPLWVQYVSYIKGLVVFDLGTSYTFNQSAMSVVIKALPASMMIVLPALLISTVFGILIGVAAATSKYRIFSRIVMVTSFLGQSVPFFWLGILLMLVIGLRWRLLPPVGYGRWEHLVLPVAAMAISHLAALSRLTRGEVADLMRRPFVLTARSKGIRRNRVIWRHVVPNALPPLVSWTALTFAFSMGQLLIIEPLFAYNGLGQVVIHAVHTHDFPIVQAGVFVIAVLVALAIALGDILNRTIDPSLSKRGNK